MAIEKSYVVTDERKLMAFLAAGATLENLEMNVGILSGRDRYAPKHVGKKSRLNRKGKTKVDKAVLGQRADMRQMRQALAAIGAAGGAKAKSEATKQIRAAFRARGISTKGLVKSSKGTAVARVAGVLQSKKYGGQYHVPAIASKRGFLRSELQNIKSAIAAGRPFWVHIKKIAEGMKSAVRAGARAAGHVDTGKLWNTTAFELINTKGRSEARQAARAIRAMKTASRRK